jgi:hypothetical protein
MFPNLKGMKKSWKLGVAQVALRSRWQAIAGESQESMFMVFQDGVKIDEIDEPLNPGYLYYPQAVKMFEACGFKIQAVSRDWNSTPYSRPPA